MRWHFHMSILAMVGVLTGGCSHLAEDVPAFVGEKSRATSPTFPASQDLAILLPIDEDEKIEGRLSTLSGELLLPDRWLGVVDEAYRETEVEDALSRENFMEDWRVVSLRIAPCSPLGQHLGQAPSDACWPEVRLVWQPVLNHHHIGWTTVAAFADDRALHTLYHVRPEGIATAVSEVVETVQNALKSGRKLADLPIEIRLRFERLKEQALETLLTATYGLRDPSLPDDAWQELDLRAETMASPEMSQAFFAKLRGFLSRFAQPQNLHTLTSFSLPEGREPATIDIWVFLAFEGHEGRLTQRTLPVFDRNSGELVADLGPIETVTTGAGDVGFSELAERDPRTAAAINESILVDPSDRARLENVINDPAQTLVTNTSCASCHSFNDLR
ncbi:MAG: hypothetical protein VX589_14035, partial [Myxococcota bacterium]|nr:hypothetical protein [Myxococcota bacterium]